MSFKTTHLGKVFARLYGLKWNLRGVAKATKNEVYLSLPVPSHQAFTLTIGGLHCRLILKNDYFKHHLFQIKIGDPSFDSFHLIEFYLKDQIKFGVTDCSHAFLIKQKK